MIARIEPFRSRCLALGWAIAVMMSLLLAPGCNTMTSQANNAEGVRLYQQGAYAQATQKFQEAIANNPTSADGYYNLAASLHKSGALYKRPSDLQQAEVLYNQCLERDPDHVECYRGLAVLLSETDRQDAAFRLMNNWNSASPNNPEPKIELARLLEESNQSEQAKAQLIEALAVAPNNARAFAALGRLRDQSGEYPQALANYQRALELNRFQPQIAARVAALNAAVGGGAPAAVATLPSESRQATRWEPSIRY